MNQHNHHSYIIATSYSMNQHNHHQRHQHYKSYKHGQTKRMPQFLLQVQSSHVSHLMVFDMDKNTPQIPLFFSFQILASVPNINIDFHIIDEKASTCIMLKTICQKLGSSKLNPFDIMLRAYDMHPSTLIGIYLSFPVKLARKSMLMCIEVLYS